MKMYIHDEWGIIYEVGDFVIYTRFNKSGIVLETFLPNKHDAGYYSVLFEDGNMICDYHYCFKLDKERTRNKRIDSILEF